MSADSIDAKIARIALAALQIITYIDDGSIATGSTYAPIIVLTRAASKADVALPERSCVASALIVHDDRVVGTSVASSRSINGVCWALALVVDRHECIRAGSASTTHYNRV